VGEPGISGPSEGGTEKKKRPPAGGIDLERKAGRWVFARANPPNPGKLTPSHISQKKRGGRKVEKKGGPKYPATAGGDGDVGVLSKGRAGGFWMFSNHPHDSPPTFLYGAKKAGVKIYEKKSGQRGDPTKKKGIRGGFCSGGAAGQGNLGFFLAARPKKKIGRAGAWALVCSAPGVRGVRRPGRPGHHPPKPGPAQFPPHPPKPAP